MSFIKSLKCFLCSKQEPILDAGFPEDLFDLITKHKVDQLFWFCKTCKNISDRDPTVVASALLGKRNNIQEPVDSLYDDCAVGVVRRTSEEKKSWSGYQNDCKLEVFGNSNEKLPSISSSCSEVLSHHGNMKEDRCGLKHVNKILSKIKIDPEEEANSKKIVQSVLTSLLYNLKKNEEFAAMFHKVFYTGSSYNDLRISSASEYDIDLVLKLPKNVKLTPVFHGEWFSFGMLKLEVMNDDNESLPVKFLKNKTKNSYLLPELISSWLQSQIDIVLNQDFELPAGVSKIKSIKSGPARTIVVKTDSEYDLSIDIVPVFEFEYSVLDGTPIYSQLRKTNDKNKDKWFMVPKQCKGEIDVTYSTADCYWRSVFPNTEKCVLYGKECAKSVIKILKMFRDKKDWKSLASYYLNMVVILEVIQNPDAEFWKNGNLFQRLLDALKQLRNYLKDQNLPHFLTDQNLLHNFNEDLCKNWYNHLTRVIPLLESDPSHLLKLFTEKESNDVLKLETEEEISSCTIF